MIETAPKPSRSSFSTARIWRIVRWALAGATTVLVLGWIILLFAWPFTREKVQRELGDATGSRVLIGSLHKTFFPPGCVLTGVTLSPLQNSRSGASIAIRTLRIRSNYRRLWSKHIDMMLEGAEARLPVPGQDIGFRFSSQTKVVVDEIAIRNSALLFHSRAETGTPLRFDIHELVLKHPGTKEVMQFEAKLRNPEPPGELAVSGKLGPWRSGNAAQTAVSGKYDLQHANLGVFSGIRGSLSSRGSFDGNVQNIQVQGTADAPDFEVTRSGHSVALTSSFRAAVNGTNGVVDLHEIHAAFRKTQVESIGTVAKDGDGRAAKLKLIGRSARIQDILLLFIQSPVPPITGDVAFTATARVPGKLADFVRQVQFTSDFDIDNGHFTTANTQNKMNHLSQEAQGEEQTEDPATAISSLTGHVELRNGIANFTNLKFRVPGALAHLHGTYDLVAEKIDMRGVLLMRADLPHATSGFKSFLLKPINVFLKKNRHGGARIPVTITGTYDNPICKTDPM